MLRGIPEHLDGVADGLAGLDSVHRWRALKYMLLAAAAICMRVSSVPVSAWERRECNFRVLARAVRGRDPYLGRRIAGTSAEAEEQLRWDGIAPRFFDPPSFEAALAEPSAKALAECEGAATLEAREQGGMRSAGGRYCDALLRSGGRRGLDWSCPQSFGAARRSALMLRRPTWASSQGSGGMGRRRPGCGAATARAACGPVRLRPTDADNQGLPGSAEASAELGAGPTWIGVRGMVRGRDDCSRYVERDVWPPRFRRCRAAGFQ